MKNLITKFVSWLLKDSYVDMAPHYKDFLEEWRSANAHSFQSLNKLMTMTKEQLQKLSDDVEGIKDTVGKLAVGLTQSEAAVAALKQQLADGNASDESVAALISTLEASNAEGRAALAIAPSPDVTVPTGDEHVTTPA